MSKQPEALRIAERCASLATIADAYSDEAYKEAAAELRRLHSVNADLLEALRFYAGSCDATETTPCGYEGNLCCKRARAALAKAEAA